MGRRGTPAKELVGQVSRRRARFPQGHYQRRSACDTQRHSATQAYVIVALHVATGAAVGAATRSRLDSTPPGAGSAPRGRPRSAPRLSLGSIRNRDGCGRYRAPCRAARSLLDPGDARRGGASSAPDPRARPPVPAARGKGGSFTTASGGTGMDLFPPRCSSCSPARFSLRSSLPDARSLKRHGAASRESATREERARPPA